MDFEDVVKKRKSVRNFSNKEADWRDIIECVDIARYAPMAGNVFTLKFIVVWDKEKVQKLAEAAQQDFVGKTKYVVVACSDPRRVTNAYSEKGEIYMRQQAGASIQNFLLAITNKGLATCWVGYFDENAVKRELKIPDNIHVEAMFPIGYETKAIADKRTQKGKIDLNGILYFEKWSNKKMKNPAKVWDVH